MTLSICRFCGTPLTQTFVDLGKIPLSNSFLRFEQLEEPEPYYPLHAWVCGNCLLVQVAELQSPERLFKEYPYFSSYSESWLEHARNFAERMTQSLALNGGHQVVEIACNDGYLLKYFLQKGIPVLGVEPAENVAKVAEGQGIPCAKKFFGLSLAQELVRAGKGADLLIANNVLAHVPALNDFVAGLKAILNPQGLLTVEFPHLLRLMEQNEFDTIYHEHFSYFSLFTAEQIFSYHDLKIFDVEELPTHGGSLRLHVRHSACAPTVSPRMQGVRDLESRAGLERKESYGGFARQVAETKRRLLSLLFRLKQEGRTIAGYGAPAKATILLNYCGIREDILDYTVDRNPVKQGLYVPGTRIPIYDPERIWSGRPDYLLILPWNLQEEVRAQMAGIREWGGRFLIPIPEPEILS